MVRDCAEGQRLKQAVLDAQRAAARSHFQKENLVFLSKRGAKQYMKAEDAARVARERLAVHVATCETCLARRELS